MRMIHDTAYMLILKTVATVGVILTIVGDWGNQCASLSRTDCFCFDWTTTPQQRIGRDVVILTS